MAARSRSGRRIREKMFKDEAARAALRRSEMFNNKCTALMTSEPCDRFSPTPRLIYARTYIYIYIYRIFFPSKCTIFLSIFHTLYIFYVSPDPSYRCSYRKKEKKKKKIDSIGRLIKLARQVAWIIIAFFRSPYPLCTASIFIYKYTGERERG